jgi:universal stress protein A
MIDLKRILVPVDFSKYSDHALRYACALARRFAAELHLLHVTDPLKGPGYLPPPEEWVEDLQQRARSELERIPGPDLGKDLNVHREIRSGFAFAEIVYSAREKSVDLIVMGTHGRSGLAHVLLGSVAEKVVRKSPCPVLTVRHPEHEFVKI